MRNILETFFYLGKLKLADLIKNKKVILGISIFFVFLFLIFPFSAYADIVANAAMLVLGIILSLIVFFLGFILMIGGIVMDLVLSKALAVQNTPIVGDGWAIARDVVNMFFIIFLLVIAFATIFRIEAYQYKALLPKLILGVLLVNFSRTIATVFIEFSNLLTAAFLNFDPAKSSTAALYALMGVDNIFDIPGTYIFTGSYDQTQLVSMISIVFILGLLALTIAGFAGLLVIRTVALLVLIVMSPIAFGLSVLPATKKVADEWWENFIKYTLYTPLAAFALYLALKVAGEINKGNSFIGLDQSGCNFAEKEYCTALQGSANMQALPIGFGGNANSFYNFALVIGLLMFSFLTIQKVGGALAGFLIGAAKMGTLGLGGKVGKAALGAIRRRLDKGGEGRIANFLKKRADLAGGKGFWAGAHKVSSFVGKGASILGAVTHIPEAWKNREERLKAEEGAPAAGRAEDWLDYTLGLGEKRHHKRRAEWAMVAKRQREADTKSSAEQVARYGESKKKGDWAGMAQALLAAIDGNNENDLVTARWGELAPALLKRGLISEDQLDKPEYSPEALKELIRMDFGERRGAELAAQISEIGATKVRSDLIGFATTDGETGESRFTTDEEEEAMTRDKAPKMGNARQIFGNMHPNVIMSELNGVMTGIHKKGRRQLEHIPANIIDVKPEHLSPALIENITTPILGEMERIQREMGGSDYRSELEAAVTKIKTDIAAEETTLATAISKGDTRGATRSRGRISRLGSRRDFAQKEFDTIGERRKSLETFTLRVKEAKGLVSRGGGAAAGGTTP